MAQMQTVTVPGTNIRAQVPATYSDAQVRKALALQYKKATGFGVEQAPVVNPKTPLNRPIPQSNEAYWKQRLAGQGNLQAAPDTIRSRISQGAASLAGLATNPRHAAQIGEKVAGVVDWVPGLGDAMGLQEAWGDLKRGVNTGDYATAGLAGLAGAATLLPGALDKPVRRGLGGLMRDESGAIRAYRGLREPFEETRRPEMEFWTQDSEAASDYANNAGSLGGLSGDNVVPADIELTKPFKLEDDEAAQELAAMLGTRWDYNPYYELLDHPDAKRVLTSKGYDGVMLPDSTGGRDHNTIVTFDPNKVRLGAFGPPKK